MVEWTPLPMGSGDGPCRRAVNEANEVAMDARSMAIQISERVLRLETTPPPVIPPPITIATGQAKTTSLLALNGSTDLVVPLSRTMPTTSYNVEVLSMTSGLVADSATITVKAKTQTSVTLTVVAKTALLANTGVTVLVWG